MRDFHRTHSWPLNSDGLFVPHCFDHMGQSSLAWWDDVGFVLNGRRVMVSWQHPRAVYSGAISDLARIVAGEGPPRARIKFQSIKNYRLVGKSGRRKKLASYSLLPSSEAQLQYDAHLNYIETRLAKQGINFEVQASWSWRRLPWGMSMSLITPMEVRTYSELASVANMARQLILMQTNLQSEFPAYSYNRGDWLKEQVTHYMPNNSTTILE